MAERGSSSSNVSSFSDAISYGLVQLGAPEIALKEEQKKAILAVYEGKDVFVSLPTGFGKSICFQILPFVFDHKGGGNHAVVVVSPLIALMIDQVQSLRCKGVKAFIISSGTRDIVPKEFRATKGALAWCFALRKPSHIVNGERY